MIELSLLLFLGILAQWLSWRIKIPSILPLILIGLFVGPFSTLLTANGQKFIDGDALFEGNLLFDFVSLAVGVILFEGVQGKPVMAIASDNKLVYQNRG